MLGTTGAADQSACKVDRVTASDAAPFDSFGRAVGLAGATALIGAFWDDDNGTNSGSAYVFHSDGATWVKAQKLLASDGHGGITGDEFGHSLAIEGDTAMIAAPNHSHGGGLGNGSVYVFRFDGSVWAEVQELRASDGALADQFGISVCIRGEVAAIGAYGDDDNGSFSGSAYIFRYDPQAATWIEEQKLVASQPDGDEQFGRAVALEGTTALIGAWSSDTAIESIGPS